jgi:hypothetical protein
MKDEGTAWVEYVFADPEVGHAHPTTAALFRALDGMRLWAGAPFVLCSGLYPNGRGGIWVEYGYEEGVDVKQRNTPAWGKLTTNLPESAQRADEAFFSTMPTTARRLTRYLRRCRFIEVLADGFPCPDTALVRFSVCDKHEDVGYAVTCEECRRLADERYANAVEQAQARLVLKEMEETDTWLQDSALWGVR